MRRAPSITIRAVESVSIPEVGVMIRLSDRVAILVCDKSSSPIRRDSVILKPM